MILPEDIRINLVNFCFSNLQLVHQKMESAEPFERTELAVSSQKYADIITFLGGGTVFDNTGSESEQMLSVHIKNGYVIYPANWITVNPEDAAECEYACVIECRNSAKYGIPHFLYLSHSYPRYFSNAEITLINELCAAKSEAFRYALDHQVDLVNDPNHPGVYLNVEEHLAAPIIGHFSLANKAFLLPGETPPFGAMIIPDPQQD